ncbi:MAG: tandem-95 repeat protein [Rhodothermaceae bacterium]|nr:tandem-95 repeat protein [Rhodothermaceae bacterium]MXW31676.1 tandem-95 repeat protein [Rhodothermaceae bacterium]MYC05408.1 tandem-95 repeat protein [Rhodothermaceae bacterium]MYE63087.1 tandem-95 repeat protein [Rhodothermaceae bacterium]MYJ20690.1 tandem-95 repeat protein [Rhodothermaceae bacterium]
MFIVSTRIAIKMVASLAFAAGMLSPAEARQTIHLATHAIALRENGGTFKQQVRLSANAPPNADVTVQVVSGDASVVTVHPEMLSFTVDNYRTWQEVTYTAVDDNILNAPPAHRVTTVTFTASGGNYTGFSTVARVWAADDEPIPFTVNEGRSYTYQTTLFASQGCTPEVISHISSDPSILTVEPPMLTWTEENTGTAQSWTVTLHDNDDLGDRRVTLRRQITRNDSGRHYRPCDDAPGAQDIIFTVKDNDDHPMLVTLGPASPPVISERGGSAEASLTTAGGFNERSVRVEVTLSGTADPGSDYRVEMSVDGSHWDISPIVFVDGKRQVQPVLYERNQKLRVIALPDARMEEDETVTLSLDGWSRIPNTVSPSQITVSGTTTVTIQAPTFNRNPTVTATCGLCIVVPGGEVHLESRAFDPDGDPLNYAWSATEGNFSGPTDESTARWTAPQETGSSPIQIQVSDGYGGFATATVVVKVVNSPPIVTASCDPCVVPRGGEVRLSVTARDPFADPLDYAWSAQDGTFAGLVTRSTARWTAPAELGHFTIQIRVSDRLGATTSAEVEVEVVNRPPVFMQSVYNLVLPENEDGRMHPVDLGRVIAEDPDGDILTYGIASGDRERFSVGAQDGVAHYVGQGENFETEPNRFELTVHAYDEFEAEAQVQVVVNVLDVNELPQVTVSCDPCVVPRGGESHLMAEVSDPDGDVPSYTWSASKGSFIGRTNEAFSRWRAPQELGRFTVRVVIDDGRNGSASAEVEITVVNRRPVFEQTVYRFELLENQGGREHPVELGRVVAKDPDGDPLTYEAVSGDRERFLVGVQDGVIHYAGRGENFEAEPNRFELTVSAGDNAGGNAHTEVVIDVADVNEHPVAVDDDVRTVEDQAVTVDVLANDTDPDGDILYVETVSAASHGMVYLAQDGSMTYTPAANFHGVDMFSYVVSDGEGLTATAKVQVTVLPVNDAPIAIGAIPDQMLDEGGASVDVDLSPFFGDVDGDVLTYAAQTSDPEIVKVVTVGTLLTLIPGLYGSVTVTVTVEDLGGLYATQIFRVGVSDRPQRAVLENLLAATARNHLASVRMALGQRIGTNRCETSRLSVRGRSVPLGWEAATAILGDVGERARATALDLGQGMDKESPTGIDLLTVSGAQARLGGRGIWDTVNQTEFLLSWGGQDRCRGRWSVWGQGDAQRFEGTPTVQGYASGYDAGLWIGYVGMDTGVGEHWLVGVALSRSKSVGDWHAGTSNGELTQTMDAIYPYLRWRGGATSVWVSVGAGRGDAKNLRERGRLGTSSLDLRLGLVELRQRFGAPGGVDFSLLGDAAWAALQTGDGKETLDGQDVRVHQIRIGADLSLTAQLGRVALMPFGNVYARRDGGTGQVGSGIEVATGLRTMFGILRLDAQARMLALHSATGYGEQGAALTLTVGRQGGEGFSLSVSPRWGDAAISTGALWTTPLGGGPQNGRYSETAPHALDMRGSYGIKLLGGQRLNLSGRYSNVTGIGIDLRIDMSGEPQIRKNNYLPPHMSVKER